MFGRKKKQEKDESDDNVLMLMRCEDMPTPVHGSTRYMADCGHECWMSPTSMVAILDPDVRLKTRCMRCVDPEALTESIRKYGMLGLPGSKDSVRQEAGDDPMTNLVINMIREHYPTTDPDGSSK